jgi:hypothetical protein
VHQHEQPVGIAAQVERFCELAIQPPKLRFHFPKVINLKGRAVRQKLEAAR